MRVEDVPVRSSRPPESSHLDVGGEGLGVRVSIPKAVSGQFPPPPSRRTVRGLGFGVWGLGDLKVGV